ncbi:hypothetical protein [uncultured Desulfobacter sp.]|uniref:hypothetical protein n=1 Tax=uncultured Desulfobacter sp. TaxID=240139 RepID=UPI0029F55E4C|nr:hypothetical protein [uncultured Desulfobacter sp.]
MKVGSYNLLPELRPPGKAFTGPCRSNHETPVKVDFDLTMSILTHNLLRLFAMDLPGYSHISDYSLYKKFLAMTGNVQIEADQVTIKIKKKRNLPLLLTTMQKFKKMRLRFFENKTFSVIGDSTT